MSTSFEADKSEPATTLTPLQSRFGDAVPTESIETWHRLGPVVSALADTEVSDQMVQRLSTLATLSRVIPATVAAHPEIATGVADPGWSVALQNTSALLQSAADEMSGTITLAEATARYSAFIDGLVARTLATAREEVAERHPTAVELPFSIVAMGKWGAQELNYSSDVDLMFVHGDGPGDPAKNRAAAIALASRIIANLSANSFDGPGLVVDADLRPEGSMGPLSRRIEAYASYYERWAEPWELQALIKARPAAGDPSLGKEFAELASKVVWETGLDVDSLRGLRRLKAEAEATAHPTDLKKAPGGIRDVEFTVQLLQLVHGRHDPTLRSKSTLDALTALEEGRYLSEDEHDELRSAYLVLRRLEHLIQIWELRQTQRLPSDEESLRRIAIGMGLGPHPDTLKETVARTRSATRTLHERIYFRPILESLVGSPSARLGPDNAFERLTALGFANTRAAADALEAMTKGISRRSRAMQQMMPLMLDWLSIAPDPDLGLSQLRMLLANTADHSSLVGRLLNNPITGERLAMLLGTGRLFGDLIDRMPEFIPRLADDSALSNVRGLEEALERLRGLLTSRPLLEDRIGTIRRFARRQRLRIAARDVIQNHDTLETIHSLSDGADAAISGAFDTATAEIDHDFALVAMGRWGGGELSYGSDLDLVYLYGTMDRETALSIPPALHEILSAPGRHGEGYNLDIGLRPEGKNGPVARSVESTARYYSEWAEPWELLALTRARPVTGDTKTIEGFRAIVESTLWAKPAPAETLASIRRIKARVENERVSPDEDADFHLKLGPGGLSDIEFLTQILQLQHGHSVEAARLPGTVGALKAFLEAGVLSPSDHLALIDSYEFCTRVRLRLHLQKGRLVDALPSQPDDLSRLAASLGYDRSLELRESYQRVTRRARRVFMTRFYQ